MEYSVIGREAASTCEYLEKNKQKVFGWMNDSGLDKECDSLHSACTSNEEMLNQINGSCDKEAEHVASDSESNSQSGDSRSMILQQGQIMSLIHENGTQQKSVVHIQKNVSNAQNNINSSSCPTSFEDYVEIVSGTQHYEEEHIAEGESHINTSNQGLMMDLPVMVPSTDHENNNLQSIPVDGDYFLHVTAVNQVNEGEYVGHDIATSPHSVSHTSLQAFKDEAIAHSCNDDAYVGGSVNCENAWGEYVDHGIAIHQSTSHYEHPREVEISCGNAFVTNV